MTVFEVEIKRFAEAEFSRWFSKEHTQLLAGVRARTGTEPAARAEEGPPSRRLWVLM